MKSKKMAITYELAKMKWKFDAQFIFPVFISFCVPSFEVSVYLFINNIALLSSFQWK